MHRRSPKVTTSIVSFSSYPSTAHQQTNIVDRSTPTCGSDHKAYVWNCQTLLDDWPLDDSTWHSIRFSSTGKSFPRSAGRYYGSQVCVWAENDSCFVAFFHNLHPGSPSGSTGARFKYILQQSIADCTGGDNQTTASVDSGPTNTCVCNHDSISACQQTV